jgi:hypothetical protein
MTGGEPIFQLAFGNMTVLDMNNQECEDVRGVNIIAYDQPMFLVFEVARMIHLFVA